MRRALAALLATAFVLGHVAPAAAVVSPTATRSARPAATTPKEQPAKEKPAKEQAPKPSSAAAQATIGGSEGADGLDPAATGDVPTELPGTPGSSGDWLFKNGLKSPRCGDDRRAAPLSCRDSGTLSIPAPPGHYALDSWMESGPFGLPKWSNVMSEVTGFIWTGIVTITVAIFGALEWTMDLDLFSQWDDGLQQLSVLDAEWGKPMAAFILTVGAIWLGIKARAAQRIGDAMKQVGAGFFLMGLSAAILANPAGTIGEITAQGSALGRQAATAPLAITGQDRRLEDGMAEMWQVVIAQPFGLLEFGDVDWAGAPVNRGGDLWKEAMRIAKAQDEEKSKSDKSLVKRVEAAKTNADLFLVWPANGDVRNSKDDEKCEGGTCLLRVLCGTDDMNACKGADGRRAMQRTDAGVTDRLGQVLLIGIGMLSVWIVLGGIVLGLLWTSITVVVTLIELAFVWPLALSFKPQWRKKVSELQLRLVGAAIAKILFGIAAGMTMTMLILIRDLGFGWVVQWIFTVVAMFLLWQRREAIADYMRTLTGGQETVTAASEATAKVLNLANGAASRFKPGGGAMAPGGAGTPAAAGPSGGGGVPTDLPTATGPGRLATLGAGVVGGVAGPAGSMAAMAAVNHAPIGAALGNVRDTVAGGIDRAMNRTADAGPTGVPVGDQANAVLSTVSDDARDQTAARSEQERRQELADAEYARQDAQRDFDAARATLDGIAPDEPGYVQALGELQQSDAAVQQATDRFADAQEATLGGGEAPAAAAPSQRAVDAADAWLDDQAAAPVAERDYRRLAAVDGVTATRYDALPAAEQAQVRERVDASLRQRPTWQPPTPAGPPSALGALQRIATGQPWRPQP